jgi:ferritin-like metal-binding protein YciE
MTEIKNLTDLFYHELQVLWSAEKMLVEKMPAMIERARHEGLKNLLALHLAETDQHKVALEAICKQLQIDPQGDFNPGMKGILEEGEMVMHKEATDEAMDATLIAGAQKVEMVRLRVMRKCWACTASPSGCALPWKKSNKPIRS